MSFAEEVKRANDGADSEEAVIIYRLSEEIGQWATDKGFREDWARAADLEQFAEDYRVTYQGTSSEDVANRRAQMLRDTAQALRMNIIASKLALAHSELSEALESLRDTGAGEMASAGNFGEELADTIIRLLDLSDMVGVNIGVEVMQKVIKNRTRPYRHGRRF